MTSPMSPAETPLLILAGGLATRLQGLAKDTPKYLQPIEDGIVFADVHLDWAARQGFRRIFLSIGHLGEKIESHCGTGRRFGLEIAYLYDGPRQIGTGGAVKKALAHGFENLAITYGDTLLAVPVTEFLSRFVESGLSGAMTVYLNRVPGHACNAELSGTRVTYDKRNPQSGWRYIDYGFLALRRRAIEKFPEDQSFDLAIPLGDLSKQGELLGFEINERFWEIGSPDALEDFRRVFQSDLKRLYGR